MVGLEEIVVVEWLLLNEVSGIAVDGGELTCEKGCCSLIQDGGLCYRDDIILKKANEGDAQEVGEQDCGADRC